jgi:hypothetical protein
MTGQTRGFPGVLDTTSRPAARVGTSYDIGSTEISLGVSKSGDGAARTYRGSTRFHPSCPRGTARSAAPYRQPTSSPDPRSAMRISGLLCSQ